MWTANAPLESSVTVIRSFWIGPLWNIHVTLSIKGNSKKEGGLFLSVKIRVKIFWMSIKMVFWRTNVSCGFLAHKKNSVGLRETLDSVVIYKTPLKLLWIGLRYLRRESYLNSILSKCRSVIRLTEVSQTW